MAIQWPIIQLTTPKETDIIRNRDSFLVIIFAKEGGMTINPITMIAPTLSKLKTVEMLESPKSR